MLRKQQALDELESQDYIPPVSHATEATVLANDSKQTPDANHIYLRKYVNLKPLDPVPELEWWDSAVLREERQGGDEVAEDIYAEKITHYVQHPVPIKNDYIENINKMLVPIHLTPKEKKRIRKMKRVEKEKDKSERIKLGLLPPPLPKLKLSNYMKVLGKEAIADPSRVEH